MRSVGELHLGGSGTPAMLILSRFERRKCWCRQSDDAKCQQHLIHEHLLLALGVDGLVDSPAWGPQRLRASLAIDHMPCVCSRSVRSTTTTLGMNQLVAPRLADLDGILSFRDNLMVLSGRRL